MSNELYTLIDNYINNTYKLTELSIFDNYDKRNIYITYIDIRGQYEITSYSIFDILLLEYIDVDKCISILIDDIKYILMDVKMLIDYYEKYDIVDDICNLINSPYFYKLTISEIQDFIYKYKINIYNIEICFDTLRKLSNDKIILLIDLGYDYKKIDTSILIQMDNMYFKNINIDDIPNMIYKINFDTICNNENLILNLSYLLDYKPILNIELIKRIPLYTPQSVIDIIVNYFEDTITIKNLILLGANLDMIIFYKNKFNLSFDDILIETSNLDYKSLSILIDNGYDINKLYSHDNIVISDSAVFKILHEHNLHIDYQHSILTSNISFTNQNNELSYIFNKFSKNDYMYLIINNIKSKKCKKNIQRYTNDLISMYKEYFNKDDFVEYV